MTLLDEGPDVRAWTTACDYDHLIPGRGAGVLLPDGTQVALFRLDDGSLRAIGNVDPFSGAAVMSRGIVGDRAGRVCVQSPIKKQAFALDDGVCIDDPEVSVPIYPTRLAEDGSVEVGGPHFGANVDYPHAPAAIAVVKVHSRRGGLDV